MIEEANLNWRYVDTQSNLIMPWYTLPTLQWLKSQDTKDWNVVEFGSGYSTIWWRLNCKSVSTVENNKIWAEAMNVWFLENQKEYINFISLNPKINITEFDCIIVDGEWREECVEKAIPYVKSGGYIIIDNYEQPSVNEGKDFSKTNELLKNWHKEIYKQPNHSDWQTAVFRKPYQMSN